jgi:hypothetical protein
MRSNPLILLPAILLLIASGTPARAETPLATQLQSRIDSFTSERKLVLKRLGDHKATRKKRRALRAKLKDIDAAISLTQSELDRITTPIPPPPPQDPNAPIAPQPPAYPPFSVEVLGDGGLVGKAQEPNVRLACDRGSIRLLPTAVGRNGYLPATCPAAGAKISEEFEKAALPVFDTCIRDLAVKLGADDVTGPITMTHLGIISAREIARANMLSLHEAGRAIDIAQVKIGNLSFDYLADLKTRGQPDSKWDNFWKKFEYCAAHTSRDAFFWPIDAESEAETIVERDITPSLQDWVAHAKPALYPHYDEYMDSVDDDGNASYDLSDEDTKTWRDSDSKLNTIVKGLVFYVMRAASPGATRKDPDFQNAILKGLHDQFSIDPAAADAQKLFLRGLKIGPILHRDHLHFSMPLNGDRADGYALG